MFRIIFTLFSFTANAFLVSFSPHAVVDYPICMNCEHVVLDEFGIRCKLFGTTDLITGDTYYKASELLRKNESECGKSGKFFFRHIPFGEHFGEHFGDKIINY